MKRVFCLIILFIAAIGTLSAQEEVSFTADRPGASTGPTTVARSVVQLEQGIQYDGDGGYGVSTFSNTLLRYGLFERMELRIGGDAIAQRGQ